jgi:hypothetical protein
MEEDELEAAKVEAVAEKRDGRRDVWATGSYDASAGGEEN